MQLVSRKLVIFLFTDSYTPSGNELIISIETDWTIEGVIYAMEETVLTVEIEGFIAIILPEEMVYRDLPNILPGKLRGEKVENIVQNLLQIRNLEEKKIHSKQRVYFVIKLMNDSVLPMAVNQYKPNDPWEGLEHTDFAHTLEPGSRQPPE